jgi:hypothetical protein
MVTRPQSRAQIARASSAIRHPQQSGRRSRLYSGYAIRVGKRGAPPDRVDEVWLKPGADEL